ncbi:MAG: threonine ammonia-lyase [Sphingomonadaceae bacterium]
MQADLQDAIDLAAIERAQQALKGVALATPCLPAPRLSFLTGAKVWVKYENLLPVGAFKERGAYLRLSKLSEAERRAGVIAMSAGNHAQAVAYHGQRLGVPVTIVMPEQTPTIKVSQTRGHGADVILHGETFDDAYAHAREVAGEKSLTFVHPFDDPQIIAGQGTVALEMLDDAPGIDTLVVPIGGGGLISGISIAAKALKPEIEIVGVEAELYPAMYARLNDKDMPCRGDTIGEGIAVKEPGRITRGIIAELVKEILLVSERDMETAIARLLQIEKTVVEGAGAAGVAALIANPGRFEGRTVGTVLCGGNIDTRLLANVLLRDLARAGRLARLRVQIQDRPGTLISVLKLFGEERVNIIEVYHQRLFTSLPAKGLYTDIECEARDSEHLQTLIARLEESGFEVHPVEIH